MSAVAASTEGSAGGRGAAQPRLVVGVLAAGGSAFVVLQSLVIPALPELQATFETSPNGAAWIMTAYLLSASVTTPIVGRAGDLWGKKRVLLAVLATLAVGAVLAGFASSLELMIVARLVQGLGGGFFPLAFGIVRDELPADRVAPGIGVISGLLGVGGGAGIVLAGPILDSLGYRWLFWAPLVVLVPTIVATMLAIPESRARATGRLDIIGAFLLSVTLVLLLVAIGQAPYWGWASGKVLAMGGVAAATAAGWVRLEQRRPFPLVDMHTMTHRGVRIAHTAALLIGLAMFAYAFLIPQFLQGLPSGGFGFGLTVSETGLCMLPFSLAMLLAAPVAGHLTRRFGPGRLLAVGSAAAGAALSLAAFAHDSVWEIVFVGGILGAGIGVAFSSLANLIVESVPQDQMGIAAGINTVIRTIGGAAGTQLVASVLVATAVGGSPSEAGFTISFLLLGLVLAVAAVVSCGRHPSARRLTGPTPPSARV